MKILIQFQNKSRMPPKPDTQKSVRKVKKEATQEFFNKKNSRSSSAGPQGKATSFTFNKAPINKAEAKNEFIEQKEKRSVKRSAFTAKLYKDDDDLDEMKVLGGDNFDSDIEETKTTKKPRDAKAQRKQDFTGSTPLVNSKIGKLSLTKGSVAMFAVSEVHSGEYAVVSHTRNVKGFINLKQLKSISLQVGQLVCCSVISVGLGVNEKGKTSNKLQLSMEPTHLYGTLQVQKITPGMFIQAIVESKEEKGYFLNLGFKDSAKGFLKFSAETKYEVGDLVKVTVVSAASKLVKCADNMKQAVQSTESVLVTEHTLKAGFLVNAKIAKIYENGVEISFLGGMTGTVFIDHIGRDSVTKFKVGEKVQARCISHNVQTKHTTLSMLPHILEMGQKELAQLGQSFTKVKVTKEMYGGSYQIKLTDTLNAFLHKSHLPGANVEVQEEDPDQKKKPAKLVSELTVGQVVDKVRVKELNYFDGVALLSMKSQIVNTVAMDYGSIEVGQFVNANIDSVNEHRKIVHLSLNDFVKGTLRLEHMADFPVKTIPTKFMTTGKSIKVRIFAIEERMITFTKKDSLMKHDVPLYPTQKSVKKGDKVIGVAVAQNEYGYIVKSFGEVKGMLNFTDIKESKKAEVKVGSAVKCYVLFNKKGSGLALTLDKKKARAEKVEKVEKSLQDFLPTDEEFTAIKESYSSLSKNNTECVGKTFNWKIVETRSSYFILRSVLEKKVKFGILPKPLATCFGLNLPIDQEDFTFEGFVFLEMNKIPIVSFNPLLTKMNDMIPRTSELKAAKTYLGLVESISETMGLTVQFPTFTQKIAIKDLQHSDLSKYEIGMPLLSAFNKAGRLSCKDVVLQNVMLTDQQQHHRQLILNSFVKVHEASTCGFKVGQKVSATIQLVKDYGLIVQINDTYTGFIVNEHKTSKSYKVGQKVSAVVLDVDNDKKIIDLSEKLVDAKSNNKTICELTKDAFMVVSSKGSYGVCILQNTCNDIKIESQYSKYRIGDEVDCRLVPNINDVKSDLLLMALKQAPRPAQEVKEGASVNGVVKSIRGHSMFIQVGHSGKQPQIGRLCKVEAQESDFKMSRDERLQVKILKVTEENGKQMIELTRRKEHLDLPSGHLNESMKFTLESLKDGQQLKAVITDVSVEASHPVQIQVSPSVFGQLLFADVVNTEALKTQSVAKILSQYKVGQSISVYHRQGQFSTQLHDASMKQLKRGDICVARYVKIQPGYGVTVQMNRTQFGLIEMCELSDDIQGCVVKHMKQKGLFLARVIGADKKGRLMLSARESVIEHWDTIVGGSTALFQQFDSKNQKQGNLRNKIIKFGPKLAIKQNDLFVGYVTNISKAGCFIQIGHNCSIRVGLNELDDAETFDFQKQMPIGRQVVGRITKCMDLGEEMRFNATLRKSLVLFGTGLVSRNQLKVGDQHTAFVLAVASDVVFGQLNGSYLKLKIKGAPKKTQIGNLLQIKLTKVEPENIKGDFIQMSAEQNSADETPKVVYESVQEEARQDIQAASEQKNQQEIDLELVVQKKRQISAMDQQIKDLETIQQIQESSADDKSGDDDDEEEMEDSDAEDIARIQNYDSDEEMKSGDDSSSNQDSEEGEAEDVEMSSESDEQEKKISGKKALRAQITQEKEIRAKEAQMRQTDGSNPQSVNDFERLLIADQDQSYLWIQYIAFTLDKLDIVAARKVAERAVKTIGMTAESDKLNLWIAYMNLENQFGTETTLQDVVKRALECNDIPKVYLQLIQIYRSSNKLEHVEPIFKKLCKKYFAELDIWSAYVEFLHEAKSDEFTQPKVVLQKALQALPKNLHINMISKYGMLEYKAGKCESGRTMFEGIVTNYPKRMDIWAIYMDMEVKHGGAQNKHQARHLFERCLSLAEIQKKPRSMKLVFRKYMEFENLHGDKKKLDALRQRVEEYLEKAFTKEQSSSSEDSD